MNFDSKVNAYFDFLKFCLNEKAAIPHSIQTIDWEGLYVFGKEQAIMGILYHGIEKLSNSPYKPETKIILKFYLYHQQLIKANKQVYEDASKITKLFKEKYGINTCIMKGQANALMYPNPWSRTPGDIDIWTDANTIEIITLARKYDAKAEIGYHHIQVSLVKTPVEIHFFPSFMGNLFYEYRMRKFFEKNKKAQFKNRKELPDNLGYINGLTKDFDRIFQLSHLMHHFFFEGIGLRQMIDYFYLLRQGFSDSKKNETIKILKHLNMYKFATAVMYIMKENLGLEEKYLLMKPNERIGKMLEREIVLSGNFGFHDERFKFGGKSIYSQYFLEMYRNFHFAIDFPSETVWGRPISRWWHMIYKAWLRHKIKE